MLWNASTPDFPGKWSCSRLHQNHTHVKISNVFPYQRMSLLCLSQRFSSLAIRKSQNKLFGCIEIPICIIYFFPSLQGDETELY